MKRYLKIYKIFYCSFVKLCFFLLFYSLLLAVLLLALAGCGNTQSIPITKIEYIEPPSYLLETTPEPRLQGESNQDLVELVLAYREALRLCNGDKEQIKGFLVKEQD